MEYLTIFIFITFFTIFWFTKKCFGWVSSKNTYQRLINYLNIGYCKCRYSDNMILAASEGFIKVFELDVKTKDIYGRSLSELFVYVDGDESVKNELRERGEVRNYEYYFKTLKGKNKCVLLNLYIKKDFWTGEKIVEALFEDITEDKLSYEKMRESQERYEKLFKNSGDMVIICKMRDFIIEEVNPAAEIVTGFFKDELINKSLKDMLCPAHRDNLEIALQDLLFRGEARMETGIICKDGTDKDVIFTFNAVDLEEDKIIIAVVKDVSLYAKEHKEREERRRDLEDFWQASQRREERIKELRLELEQKELEIERLKNKLCL